MRRAEIVEFKESGAFAGVPDGCLTAHAGLDAGEPYAYVPDQQPIVLSSARADRGEIAPSLSDTKYFRPVCRLYQCESMSGDDEKIAAAGGVSNRDLCLYRYYTDWASSFSAYRAEMLVLIDDVVARWGVIQAHKNATANAKKYDWLAAPGVQNARLYAQYQRYVTHLANNVPVVTEDLHRCISRADSRSM